MPILSGRYDMTIRSANRSEDFGLEESRFDFVDRLFAEKGRGDGLWLL